MLAAMMGLRLRKPNRLDRAAAVVVEQPSRPASRAPQRPVAARQAGTPRRQPWRRAAATCGPHRSGPRLSRQPEGTGTKTDTPLRETPQSITVVTATHRRPGRSPCRRRCATCRRIRRRLWTDSRGDYPRFRGQIRNLSDGTRGDTYASTNGGPIPIRWTGRGAARPVIGLYGDTSTAGLLNLISSVRSGASNEMACNTQFRPQAGADGLYRQADQGWRVAVPLHRHLPDSGTQTDFVPDDRIVLALP